MWYLRSAFYGRNDVIHITVESTQKLEIYIQNKEKNMILKIIHYFNHFYPLDVSKFSREHYQIILLLQKNDMKFT